MSQDKANEIVEVVVDGRLPLQDGAKNVEPVEAVDTPWCLSICCIPRTAFAILVLLNDTLDTTTDIIFAVQLFNEGKTVWGGIMSAACVFGLFNFLSSIPYAKIGIFSSEHVLCFWNRKKADLMKKAFKSPSLTALLQDVFQKKQGGKDRENVIQNVLQTTRINYMGQYLCCYKLGEDIPASIIRLLYVYEKQTVACSKGIALCILPLIGTTTNMFGLLLSVLIFFYFACVIFKTSWLLMSTDLTRLFGSVSFMFGFVLIAIGSLLGSTAYYLAHAGFYAPTFVISTELVLTSYVFMGVIAMTSVISIRFHLHE